MGGKSSSSSSSSNTTSTENYDQRVAVEAGGIGIGADAVVDLQLTDYGVIEGAVSVINDVFAGASEVVNNVTEAFAGVVSENNAILKEETESDAKELTVLVVKIVGGLAAIFLVIRYFMRGRT